MRILLLGPNGQVGWELQRSLQPLGEVIALERQREGLCGDLARPDELASTVRLLRPDVIVNAAAYTAVDKAESEPELANVINAQGPAALASVAKEIDAWLVHYSTDYVFDGSGDQPRNERHPTGPLNVYGRTKLEGENAIRASGCMHLVIRTSWVYATYGNNFAKTMLRLAAERDQIEVVDDQVGSPTGADLIADVTSHLLRGKRHSALYHLAASGQTTWFDYARLVLDFAAQHGVLLRTAADAIRPVSSASRPTIARRPANSRLDCALLSKSSGLHLPDWTRGVRRMLTEHLGIAAAQRR